MAQIYSWAKDGGLCRGDTRFVPVGANYRPPTGATSEVLRDEFGAIVAAGLNAIRIEGARNSIESEWARELLRLGDECGLAVQFADGPDRTSDGALPTTGFNPVVFSAQPSAHVLGFDGLSDPFFHSLLPFAVQHARAGGTAIVTSFGVGVPLGARVLDTWLRAALPAAHAAGAAGFFWADVRGPGGVLEDDGRVRAGLEFLGEFARAPFAAKPRPVIGLWIGADPAGAASPRVLLAHYFLRLAGRDVRLVSAAAGLETDCRQLLVAGIPVSADDQRALRAWVEQGGELFWHGPDPLMWGEKRVALLGARLVDWRSGRGISVQAFGERFTLAHFPHEVRAELAPCGATVLAADHQGLPLLLEHRVGRGRVRYALPMVEDAIVPVAAHPAARDRWLSWYRGMLAAEPER